MEKDIIQIGLEFVFGPLLKDEVDENGNDSTGVKFVDEDVILQKLDKETSDLWCSLWSNDPESPSGMHFDEIREKDGKPIIITSGYRCQELNKKVGGKSNSFHLKGLAADLKYSVELWTFLTQHAKFDKLILETSKSAKWIHCQFSKENERNQILSLNV